MTHSLTIEVPENIYRGIVNEAESKKRKVEDIALERLAKDTPPPIDDSLDNFVGAFSSDVPDWTEKHDEYIGEKLAEDLKVNR